MKMIPLNDRVVIHKCETDEVTKGGIFIPEVAKEKPMQGVVVAIAENSKIKVGDHVLFGKFAGSLFHFEGEELLILSDKDLFMKLED